MKFVFTFFISKSLRRQSLLTWLFTLEPKTQRLLKKQNITYSRLIVGNYLSNKKNRINLFRTLSLLGAEKTG